MELAFFVNGYNDLIELSYINYCASVLLWVSSQ